jgi:hypothetical protein
MEWIGADTPPDRENAGVAAVAGIGVRVRAPANATTTRTRFMELHAKE